MQKLNTYTEKIKMNNNKRHQKPKLFFEVNYGPDFNLNYTMHAFAV